jgi:hypothetical protein
VVVDKFALLCWSYCGRPDCAPAPLVESAVAPAPDGGRRIAGQRARSDVRRVAATDRPIPTREGCPQRRQPRPEADDAGICPRGLSAIRCHNARDKRGSALLPGDSVLGDKLTASTLARAASAFARTASAFVFAASAVAFAVAFSA